MDRRQLIRTGAVVVAALALCFLGWRGTADNAEPTVSHDGTTYAGVVADLQRVLATYGQLAQEVVQHDQAHFVDGKLQGLESSLGVIRDRAAALDTEEGDAAAVLAEFVRARGSDVRRQAAADHVGMTGIETLQAFGREVSLRAVRIGEVLPGTGGAGEDTAAWGLVDAEVTRPWPVPELEGVDDPVPG